MKKMTRILSILMAAIMALTMISTAFAATTESVTIDTSKEASLTVYKFDITKASSAQAWDGSYVSTGKADTAVTTALSKYAIQGVEFTYLKLADITTYTADDGKGNMQDIVLYGFSEGTTVKAVLDAIGLKYTDAYSSDGTTHYFTSDALNKALADKLTANATTVKNAMEKAVATDGTAMTETDATGKASADKLAQGLYLVVETSVPENVTSTVNPFFVSLPMTTIDGSTWNYDVTVYPKNETGEPTLEKTVRESKNSTGNNTGSVTSITDGYAHTATVSEKDTVEYQIISTMPTITSEASYLTTYTYVDTLSKGLTYNKSDVVIEFFKDAACTEANKITTWETGSDNFAVAYDDAKNTLTVSMTEKGLKEINSAATVYTDSLFSGYSDCTMRITYAAKLNGSAIVYGDSGNPNTVVLTWKRTNTTYSDTLTDDCHVYSYGIDLAKKFSDDAGTLSKVKFRMYNATDKVYILAENKSGVYYVTGFTTEKDNATVFTPHTDAHILVKGLEADTYKLTETATDSGYVLLRDDVTVVITTADDDACETCGAKLLTASATVNGEDTTMTGNNAIVPLTVMNNKGFVLPKTGGYGTWAYTVGGVLLLGAAAFVVLKSRKKEAQ